MSPKNTTYSDRGGRAARAAHARGEKEFSKYDVSAVEPKKRGFGRRGRKNDKKKKEGLGHVPLALVIAIAICTIVVGYLAVTTYNDKNPNMVPDGQEVEVTFRDGLISTEFGSILYDAGLIENKRVFSTTVQDKGVATQLKSGTYTFVGGMTYDEIIDQLVEGPGMGTNPVVVPEGSTIDEVAAAVEDSYDGAITADEFKAECANASKYAEGYSFLEGAYNDSLEGFLFPKTYEVRQGSSAEDVVRQMLDQYQTEISSLDFSKAEAAGLSQYDVLKLASIVEREATSDNQREVASVFYNRLAADMPLQSDATTAYVVGGDPTPDDLKVDGPYNTYLNKGLPAGPICSPGLSCLQAVCDPADTDYLYFVFYENDEGGMDYYFNETYEGHQQAIAEHSGD